MLLAIVLTVGVLWAYTQFMAPEPPPPQPEPQKAAPARQERPAPAPQAQPAPAAPGQAAQAPAARAPQAPAEPAREVKVETPLMTAWFSERGAALRKVVLKRFHREAEGQGGPYVLLDLGPDNPYSLAFDLPGRAAGLGTARWVADRTSLEVAGEGQRKELVFTVERGGVVVRKTYTIPGDSYAFGLQVAVTNQSGQAVELNPELSLVEDPLKEYQNDYAFTGLLLGKDGDLVELDKGDLEERPRESGAVRWMAMSIPYFMGAVAPLEEGGEAKRVVRGVVDKGYMAGTLVEPPMSLAPGATGRADYLVFYGPRDLDVLEPLGHGLANAVDFGWFDIIAKPMLAALKLIYSAVGNYGVAIIIITILVKFLFWPLTAKSYKSMKQMQKLQPQIKKLREKYKNDKQRMNQEVMQMYKTYKVNPMGGCLPMLVQIPVFIAFYKVLYGSIELRHAPFMLWINDLSAPDRLFPDLGIPYVGGIPVLTLLMGASMFLQQKMTPATMGDPTQQKMMMLMPIVFTFIFIQFPAGLVLYWLVNNLLSIGQQYYTNQKKE
jgi:YidC/Oxa1 family membrane protein insertase